MKIKVNEKEFSDLMKNNNNENLLVVDFFATWCGPCKMFLPVFEKVASELKDENVKMVTVDIDQSSDLALKSKITGVPTVLFFKNGEEVNRFSGFVPQEELEKLIEENKK